MPTYVACCTVVPAATKEAAEEAIYHLTPVYGRPEFIRAVVPASPAPTWETTATHWRGHDVVDQWLAMRWQAVAADGALPADYAPPEDATMTEQEIIDALDGVTFAVENDVVDTNAWAQALLAPRGLTTRPNPPL